MGSGIRVDRARTDKERARDGEVIFSRDVHILPTILKPFYHKARDCAGFLRRPRRSARIDAWQRPKCRVRRPRRHSSGWQPARRDYKWKALDHDRTSHPQQRAGQQRYVIGAECRRGGDRSGDTSSFPKRMKLRTSATAPRRCGGLSFYGANLEPQAEAGMPLLRRRLPIAAVTVLSAESHRASATAAVDRNREGGSRRA